MALIQARLLPKLASDLDWIDARCLPPGLLVARTMNRAVVSTTERHRELVAGFSAERARLYEAQVVGVRGLAAADEAGLLGDVSKVLPVAVATRGGEREDALVDALAIILVGWGTLALAALVQATLGLFTVSIVSRTLPRSRLATWTS
jgi:hypothetical protein